MGTIPVTVSTKSVDKETVVTERVLIYVVKELKSIFLSKDTLVEMSVIPEERDAQSGQTNSGASFASR